MVYRAVAGGQPLTAAVLKQPIEPTPGRLAAIAGKLSLISAHKKMLLTSKRHAHP